MDSLKAYEESLKQSGEEVHGYFDMAKCNI